MTQPVCLDCGTPYERDRNGLYCPQCTPTPRAATTPSEDVLALLSEGPCIVIQHRPLTPADRAAYIRATKGRVRFVSLSVPDAGREGK